MQKNSKKLIAFDIDTYVTEKILGKGYRVIYANIEKHFIENEFKHVEGSTYSSKVEISDMRVAQIIDDLLEKYPYLKKCIRDIRQANVVNEQSLNIHFEYDGTPGEYAKKQEQSKDAKQCRKSIKRKSRSR